MTKRIQKETTNKEVTLTSTEFLNVLTICKTIRTVAIERNDSDESTFMSKLISKLLTYKHNDDDTATLELPTDIRFAFWLSLDQYREFCAATNNRSEQDRIETTMKKFQ